MVKTKTKTKNNCLDAGDLGLIPGLGRRPGGGHGYPLQYSNLKNPTDREAWRATVHRVKKNWAQLKQLGIQRNKMMLKT